jgi:hypothetical protein
MPGRRLTASLPPSTWISSAVYSATLGFLGFFGSSTSGIKAPLSSKKAQFKNIEQKFLI